RLQPSCWIPSVYKCEILVAAGDFRPQRQSGRNNNRGVSRHRLLERPIARLHHQPVRPARHVYIAVIESTRVAAAAAASSAEVDPLVFALGNVQRDAGGAIRLIEAQYGIAR